MALIGNLRCLVTLTRASRLKNVNCNTSFGGLLRWLSLLVSRIWLTIELMGGLLLGWLGILLIGLGFLVCLV